MSRTYVPTALRRLVRERAGVKCEYCGLPESVAFATHEVEHFVAEKHRGETVAENLALSCSFCNKHKGSDLTSIDPESGETVRLIHPRQDEWAEHFKLDDSGKSWCYRQKVVLPLFCYNSIGRIDCESEGCWCAQVFTRLTKPLHFPALAVFPANMLVCFGLVRKLHRIDVPLQLFAGEE